MRHRELCLRKLDAGDERCHELVIQISPTRWRCPAGHTWNQVNQVDDHPTQQELRVAALEQLMRPYRQEFDELLASMSWWQRLMVRAWTQGYRVTARLRRAVGR